MRLGYASTSKGPWTELPAGTTAAHALAQARGKLGGRVYLCRYGAVDVSAYLPPLEFTLAELVERVADEHGSRVSSGLDDYLRENKQTIEILWGQFSALLRPGAELLVPVNAMGFGPVDNMSPARERKLLNIDTPEDL